MTPTSLKPALSPPDAESAWLTVLSAAAAGGMGWGIRGQYGHETGAMIAGVLVSLVLVLRLAPSAALLTAARAVALGTIAMGFGGSMTYGQTLGLTQNPTMIGNASAFVWGMLGLAVKGGLWIGCAGLFLGLGLSSRRTGWLEMACLATVLVGLFFLGIWLFNSPFDPATRELPRLYFSADWRWEPEAVSLRPRPEVWGGMLLAVAGGWIWLGLIRGDALARRLTGWGLLGGAIGFPLGQCLQAGHAWHRDWFAEGAPLAALDGLNWWNWMETTFGGVMAAVLAVGLIRNRHLIGLPQAGSSPQPRSRTLDLTLPVEIAVLAGHVSLLVLCEFIEMPPFNRAYDHGFVAGVLPLAAVAGGRVSPFLVFLPLTLLPIAFKTVAMLVLDEATIEHVAGWLVYGVIPMVVVTGLAIWLARRACSPAADARPLAPALIATTLTYFLLNFAVFRFPWPWAAWTARTPNAMAFLLAAGLMLVVALRSCARRCSRRDAAAILDSTATGGQD